MLKSMTGFAQASARYKDVECNIEIRSLNHRYVECLAHVPDGLGGLEEVIKDQVKSKIARGRVTVALSVSKLHPKVSVDYGLAGNYVRTLKQLNGKLKLKNDLTLSQIISLEGVLKVEKITPSPEFMQAIKSLLDKTLEKLVHIRQKEGKAVASDILGHIAVIEKEIVNINLCSKALYKEKKGSLSEDEYCVFLKNTDIAEELSRLNYHLKNFRNTVKKSPGCGKELDFIAQEMQREANTISAKAQNAKISSSVVKVKSAVDRIREQAQNVE